MASLPVPGVNVLPHLLATIIFHHSQTQDYEPEFVRVTSLAGDPGGVRGRQAASALGA